MTASIGLHNRCSLYASIQTWSPITKIKRPFCWYSMKVELTFNLHQLNVGDIVTWIYSWNWKRTHYMKGFDNSVKSKPDP